MPLYDLFEGKSSPSWSKSIYVHDEDHFIVLPFQNNLPKYVFAWRDFVFVKENNIL